MSGPAHRAVGRRRLLRAAGAGAIAAFAGCTGDDEDDAESQPEVDPRDVEVDDDATWRTASIVDVTTGEEFRIADFDRPAIVHTFARGCAACHSQQLRFADFYAESDVEIVDLTIDPNDDPEAIREYAAEDDFGWRFGASPEPVTGSLVDTFGEDVTVSAASPVIVVCPDDAVYSLDKVVDADELELALDEAC